MSRRAKGASGAKQGSRQAAAPAPTWHDLVLPVGVGAVLAAPVLSSGPASSAAVMLAALLTAGIGLLVPGPSARWVVSDRSRRLAAIALAVFVGVMLVATLRAQSPLIALFGALGQRLGVALWIACIAWLWVGVRYASKRSLRRLMMVIAVGGGLYALVALLERVSGTVRAWGSAAGVLENSLTLGSLLVLGLAASGAVFVTERAMVRRVTAAVAGLACVAGLFVAESRGALFGLLAAVAAAIAYRTWRSARGRLVTAVALPVAGAGLTAYLVAAASGAFGASAYRAINALGNDRLIIWRAAADAVARDGLLGRGLEHFTAVLSFGYAREDLMGYQSALDPHNVLLAVLIGGGVLALASLLVAAGALLKSALDSSARAGSPLFLGLLIGGVVGVGAAALFAWPGPAAFVASAALTGCVIGVSRPQDASSSASGAETALHYGAGALAIALALTAVGPLRADRYFASLPQDQRFNADELAKLSAIWPTASMEAREYQVRTVDNPQLAPPAGLARRVDGYAGFHVDAAAGIVQYELAQHRAGDDAAWDRAVSAAEKGRQADGATVMWDYWLATAAAASDRQQDAEKYAGAALAKEPTGERAAELNQLLGD